jgi:hypothetical protein
LSKNVNWFSGLSWFSSQRIMSNMVSDDVFYICYNEHAIVRVVCFDHLIMRAFHCINWKDEKKKTE